MSKHPEKLGPAFPRCIVCGEDTCHSPSSSMFGQVHRWGPTDHAFVSDSDASARATRTVESVIAMALLPGAKVRVVDEGPSLYRYSVEVFRSQDGFAHWENLDSYADAGSAVYAMAKEYRRLAETVPPTGNPE